MLKKLNHEKGFTLLELLLSVAIISLIAGFSLPVYRTLLSKNDLDISATVTASILRRAQTLSQAVDGDSTWGVKIQSASIVLFKGTSYATRDASYDENFDLSAGINPSTTEYIFSKVLGLPQNAGTLTLTTESDTRTITINEKGMVNY